MLKSKKMDEALLKNLIYLTQVSLFAGIALIIFAWVEKKILFEKAGHFIFIALGLLAGWILLSGSITVPEVNDGNVPKTMQLIFYLFGLVIASFVGLAAFILHLFASKLTRWLNGLLVLIALPLFFMVYNLITG